MLYTSLGEQQRRKLYVSFLINLLSDESTDSSEFVGYEKFNRIASESNANVDSKQLRNANLLMCALETIIND